MSRYDEAKKIYAGLGVDTEKALNTLKDVTISVHCWQVFNLYAVYIMRNAGLDKDKLESRLPGEISTTSDMQMIPI